MNNVFTKKFTFSIGEIPEKRKDSFVAQYFEELFIEKYGNYDLGNFLNDFISNFDDGFKGLRSEGNAVRITSQTYFNQNKGIIQGVFLGGKSGMVKKVFKRNADKDEEPVHTIKADQVSAGDFYFHIGMPKDKAIGTLIIQGLSSESSVNVFKVVFLRFLKKTFINKYTPVSPFLSKNYVKGLLERSSYDQVKLTRYKVPKDRIDTILGQEIALEDMTIEIIFKGAFNKGLLNKMADEAFDYRLDRSSFFSSEILDTLDFEDSFNTSLKMHDPIYHKDVSRQSKLGFEINPKNYVAPSLISIDKETNRPTITSLRNIVEAEFEIMKKELYG